MNEKLIVGMHQTQMIISIPEIRQSSGRNPISHDYIFRYRGRGRCNISKSNISDVLSWFFNLNLCKYEKHEKGRGLFLWISDKIYDPCRGGQIHDIGTRMFLVRQPSQNSPSPRVAQHHLFENCDDMNDMGSKLVISNHLFGWFGVIGLKG